jgi:hypothetical protein
MNILYRLAEESIGLKVNKTLKKLQVSKNRMSIFLKIGKTMKRLKEW